MDKIRSAFQEFNDVTSALEAAVLSGELPEVHRLQHEANRKWHHLNEVIRKNPRAPKPQDNGGDEPPPGEGTPGGP